jgi:hypothetical protein
MNRIFAIILIIAIAISIAFILPEEKLGDKIKIGVSDDISGFIVDYMITDEKLDVGDELEAYFIKDC